ncbi:hypothetical protein AGMMS49975_12310 [Clostridia bacterium]|nr:hypothetical protein AGMMS49975_12310 [Clostridia bacterium]
MKNKSEKNALSQNTGIKSTSTGKISATTGGISKTLGINEPTAEKTLKQTENSYKLGVPKNVEVNATLSSLDGSKVIADVIGENGHISDTSKNVPELLKYLKTADPYSVVMVHNHNNVSDFSLPDLDTFFKYKSIYAMTVIDEKKNIYGVAKHRGLVYNWSDIKETYISNFKSKVKSILTTQFRYA